MLGNRNGPIRWRSLLPMLLLVLSGSLLMAGVAMAGRADGASGGLQAQKGQPSGKQAVTAANVAIPDHGTITDTLIVTTVATISDVDVVGLTISHTFPGDLNVYLIDPTGMEVQLFSGVCGGTDWNTINTGFTISDGAYDKMGDVCPPGHGLYSPVGQLSSLNGMPTTGLWKLRITDMAADDTGVLVSWGLAFNAAATPPQPVRTPTAVPTLIPTETPVLGAENFSDVSPGEFFYQGVRFLLGKGAISGYNDAAHCGSSSSCFLPGDKVTRAQFAKIVTLGLQLPLLGIPPAANVTPFTDVSAGNPFKIYVDTARTFGIVSGYNDAAHCGSAIPCFQPFESITRGQLAKMVVVAAGWDVISPATPTFSDVPTSSPFYSFVETAACFGAVSGYGDHTFKWMNSATRGQVAKIVYFAYTVTNDQACPAGRPTQ